MMEAVLLLSLSGKILLVGNMGLYDYRPYVKKITNDRQILFDCDKGYKLGIGTETQKIWIEKHDLVV